MHHGWKIEDIQLELFDVLSRRSLANLACTCRYFQHLLEPLVWRTRYETDLTFLIDHSTKKPSHRHLHYVRTLYLHERRCNPRVSRQLVDFLRSSDPMPLSLFPQLQTLFVEFDHAYTSSWFPSLATVCLSRSLRKLHISIDQDTVVYCDKLIESFVEMIPMSPLIHFSVPTFRVKDTSFGWAGTQISKTVLALQKAIPELRELEHLSVGAWAYTPSSLVSIGELPGLTSLEMIPVPSSKQGMRGLLLNASADRFLRIAHASRFSNLRALHLNASPAIIRTILQGIRPIKEVYIVTWCTPEIDDIEETVATACPYIERLTWVQRTWPRHEVVVSLPDLLRAFTRCHSLQFLTVGIPDHMVGSQLRTESLVDMLGSWPALQFMRLSAIEAALDQLATRDPAIPGPDSSLTPQLGLGPPILVAIELSKSAIDTLRNGDRTELRSYPVEPDR
ncbi:hypothetical protein CALCODRAFT_68667 [Calocera cornea HHB12733]|uniref:F-box domain-containing protein n=1 Tax=Calocera cornea HHB12733 TaxID=1353952 RepID=A0A165DJ90_9BASI|nr:hypothetical protein CALCODRAFT_68667 [Calocera cornea HHB12733]